jgi:hypothetical protein
MFFLLLLLATASCTLNAMDPKDRYINKIPKELPEDFPEIKKVTRKNWIEYLHEANQRVREILTEEANYGKYDFPTAIAQNNSNSKQQ